VCHLDKCDEIDKIKLKINKLKSELFLLTKEEGSLDTKEVIKKSQELDRLIALFMKNR